MYKVRGTYQFNLNLSFLFFYFYHSSIYAIIYIQFVILNEQIRCSVHIQILLQKRVI